MSTSRRTTLVRSRGKAAPDRDAPPDGLMQRLARSSGLIILATLIDAGVGFCFWALAARSLPAATVGVASTAVSLITLAAIGSTMGMDWNLIDLLPRVRQRSSQIVMATAAIALAGAVGLIVGAATVVVVPWLADDLSGSFDGTSGAIAALGVGVLSVSLVVDGLLLGMGRPVSLVGKRGAIAVLKLLGMATLVFLLTDRSNQSSANLIMFIWIGAAALTVGWVVFRMLAEVAHVLPVSISAGTAVPTGFLRRGGLHHLSNVAGQLPQLTLPVLVLTRLGAEASAHVYVAWMLGSGLFMISSAVAKATLVQGASATEHVGATIRQGARIVGVLYLVASAGLLVVGPPVLGAFGADYRAVGGPLLIVLVFAAIPDAITNVWVARWQVLERTAHTAILNILIASTTVPALWFLLPSTGVRAVGWAWLIGQSFGIGYALLIELRWRQRTRHDGLPADPAVRAEGPFPTFIVGAHKAGTTTAYEMLGSHPDVYAAEEKEPGYFSIADKASYPSWWRYQARVAEADASFHTWLDGSTSYGQHLKYPDTITRMKRAFGMDVKIIYLVRDPLARINSGWAQLKMEGVHRLSATAAGAIDVLIEPTLYHSNYLKYADTFGADHIHVGLFEDLISDPDRAWAEWLEFLELPPCPAPVLHHANSGDDHRELPGMVGLLIRVPGLDGLRRGTLGDHLGKMVRSRSRTIERGDLTVADLGKSWNEVRAEATGILEVIGAPTSVWPSLD